MNSRNYTVEYVFFFDEIPRGKILEKNTSFKYHNKKVISIFTRKNIFAVTHEDNVVNLFKITGKLRIPSFDKILLIEPHEFP
jgi:hypothetical protein